MKNFLFFSLLFIGAITISLNGYAQTDNFPGDALDFDGTNDYVTIPHSAIGNPASGFTIEVWTKLTAYPTNDADIISKHKNDGGNARSGYALEYNSSNGIKAIMGTSDGWKHVYGSTWNLNEWHHIAMVYNASTNLLELFDNGASQGTVTVNNPAFNTMNLYFGSSEYYTANLLSGKIDEVRYWTVARTSQEIRENMNLPLSCSETGLVSYWQCNDGSGTTLLDIVSRNDGTLTNMTDDDWVNSTIPFGPGYSNSETEATGTVSFTNTGLSMNFSSQNGAEITTTRIDTLPNVNPGKSVIVFDNQYWVVNRYGSGSFNTDLTFTISEDLTTLDESNPSSIKLYTRSSTANSNWVFLKDATSVNAANNEATFSGITKFRQFIIAKTSPLITLYQNHFDLKTNNFNSIDIGYSSAPAFTDLDGDGLLDLMVGESDGNLNHYEQDSENSTSFTLVTHNFNSIDVGSFSTPAFTDLDGDGLLDLMVGEGSGNLNHYEQDAENSTSFTLVTENFDSINIGIYSAPVFTDLDGDGLLDLIVGELDGNLNHYEQDVVNSTSFTLITENFDSINVVDQSTPTFTDLDGDGLLDLMVGEGYGNLYHYVQDAINSTSFTLVTNNFNSIDVGDYSTPAFTDLDGDGLLDLMVGEDDGNLNHYEQQGVSSINFGKILTGNTKTKVYSVKGSNLTANLDISCPSAYKVSLSENSGYVQSLSISPLNGQVSDSIYICFKPVAEVTYSGNISHSSTDAETKNIAVSGTGGACLTDIFPGDALDFDGANDYVSIPHDSIGNPSSDFTIEAWTKLTAYPSGNADIISKIKNNGGSARSGYALEYNSSNGISAIMGTPNGWKTVEGSTWNLNEWHHITLVYNATTHLMELFDNGVSEGTVTVNNPAFNTMNLYFGSSEYYPSNLLSGQIDEIRFWGVAHDSTQIRENMYNTLSGYESGLVSYWQCNDGSATTLSDVIGGNAGTLTNMTDDDWVPSTAPLPFTTIVNGPWEQDATWDAGQNAPINPWSRVKIKHHDTLNSNMEVIEITVDTNAVITISAGDTLTVTGHKDK